MGRVVNPDTAGKQRNQDMRTAAELLRRLSQKSEFDDEAKDMAAQLVFCFRSIENGVEEAMVAWEKRNYWNKVEQFRSQWIWVGMAAAKLEQVIRAGTWDQLPPQLMGLLKHFQDITITKFTRGPETWQGAYQRLSAETPPTK
jgi:hypothetical protein